MDEIYNLVQEINANTRAIEQAAREGEQAPTMRQIPGGLGTVMVDGLGTLVSVNLNRDALATQSGASLARQLLQTIQQAESEAHARRDAMIAEAQRKAQI